MLGFEKKGARPDLRIARKRDELSAALTVANAAGDKEAAINLRTQMMLLNGGVVEGKKGKSAVRDFFEGLIRDAE
jgi:hypothetical protein